MILLWGVASDPPLAAVQHELRRLDVPFVLLDQRHVLATELDISSSDRIDGAVRSPGASFELAAVSAVYARPYDSRRLPGVKSAGPGSFAWRHALAVDEALLCWLDLTPAPVVNRPAAMAANNSKPYQLQLIRQLGFNVPETLVTTDPKAAQRFWERHGQVVYKSVSGIRSRVSRLRAEHLPRLADVAHCPTQFQAFVEGTDYRAHVVGQDVLTCQVRCDADDYRYPDGNPLEMQPHNLPHHLEDLCRHTAASMGLSFAGIDLRRTPANEWYCFEVNPSPGFTYYEGRAGLPIAAAVARLLAGSA